MSEDPSATSTKKRSSIRILPPGKLVVSAGLKGGTGKTTLSTQLAFHHAEQGGRSRFLDLTFARHALTWVNRVVERPRPEVLVGLGAAGWESPGGTVTFVDLPSEDRVLTAEAMRHANLVLVPVVPGATDIEALPATLEIVRSIRGEGHIVKTLVVLNKAKRKTVFSELVSTSIKERTGPYDVKHHLNKPICDRVSFPEALTAGMSVVAYATGSHAADELETLANRIKKMLEAE